VVNSQLITGLADPSGLAYVPTSVPERPSFLVSGGLLIPLILFACLRRKPTALAAAR
jgi:hypothetical protein